MKVLNAQQIHSWDDFTIQHEPISSLDLMERAAQVCTDYITQLEMFNRHIKVFCGKGNNGGDGLAIARQLYNQHYTVSVYIIEFGAVGTNDFQANLHRLHEMEVSIHFIQSEACFPDLNESDVVIDALYGSGLNRPLQNLGEALVKHINQSNAFIISIDVPSGMFIDKSSKGNTVIRANLTLTFQSYKLCFLVAENEAYTGVLKILDIGLLPLFLESVEAKFQIANRELIQLIYRPRKPFSHKGNYGHALIIAGNTGKMGAALMTTHACLRTGAGLTTLNVPSAYLNAVHASLPEAMCQVREEGLKYEGYNVVAIGPGIGKAVEAGSLVEDVLKNFNGKMVADADALNIIAATNTLLQSTCNRSVLTPHPKEFERLFGKAENDFERIEMALQQSEKLQCVIVLKGKYTLTAYKGKGWFNITGNAGLAKGGSGDVLTGIITALLAQHYTLFEAAVFGVYLHGLAADIALEKQSEESLLASDVIENLGSAFNSFY
ncbi:MAG: NAD(P)H-hydrate dehydratase [Bacteroidetes bacterium]|nr:NAD(P)H-hydrate dehydratase [Bacteroidota bacterium]